MQEPANFINLDRRFKKLGENPNPEISALDSYSQALWAQHEIESSLKWEDLLEHQLVVVLGEPGSGKTYEFKAKAISLSKEGKSSFFIPLDRLINEDVGSILGPEESEKLVNWKRGSELGFFFLDSVDESKFFKVSEFDACLEKLRRGIGNEALNRARIHFSSRVSEWRPESDKRKLLENFPSDSRSRKYEVDQGIIETEKSPSNSPLVVQLLPLDPSRVELFVVGSGLPNPSKFLEALNESNSWEFAGRPLDVNDLVEFWLIKKHLGSLKELIEFNIKTKLRETEERKPHDPLSEGKALEGAEALGAATILCCQFNFKIPDDSFVTTGGLAPESCLPENWRPNEIRSLITRPIFDSASYGRIRFHHRRVAEYLAFQWFEKRMQEGCPLNELEDILFDFVGTKHILRPSLAPVAAWLCCAQKPWAQDLRTLLLKSSPEIHLNLGDPTCLPWEYRLKVIRELSHQSEGGKYIDIYSDPETLKRFADPALSNEFSEIIERRSLTEDFRILIILIVRHGKLQDCLDSILNVISSDVESVNIKSYAVSAVRDIGDENSRRRLAEIAKQFPNIPNNLCAYICQAIYPSVINADELIYLLKKTFEVPEHQIDMPYYLSSHLKSALTPENCGGLLPHLIELGQTPPLMIQANREIPVSIKYSWVNEVVPTVLELLFKKSSLTEGEIEDAAEALWWLGLENDNYLHRREDSEALKEATRHHPLVRQKYFWRQIDTFRQQKLQNTQFLSRIFDPYNILFPEEPDFDWLIDDICSKREGKDREIALRLAITLCIHWGLSRKILNRIRREAAKGLDLFRIFKDLTRNMRWLRIRRIWYCYFSSKLFDGFWWGRQFYPLKQYATYLYEQWLFFKNLKALKSGNQTILLYHLIQEASENPSKKWGLSNLALLEKKRGRIIAKAVNQGCKRAWRLFLPQLPHEKSDPQQSHLGVRIGLTGLQLSLNEGELDFKKLSWENAKRVTHYAVNELNGFPPWFGDLIQHHSGAVQEILSSCIKGEWQWPEDRQFVHEVMAKLAWQGDRLGNLVKGVVMEQLNIGDPPNYNILQNALTIMAQVEEPPLLEIASLAVKRLGHLALGEPSYSLWWSVLIQIDANKALEIFEENFSENDDRIPFMISICAILQGDNLRKKPKFSEPNFMQPAMLRWFIPIVYRYVRLSDDIHRVGRGVFSPGERDAAQDFRNSLLVRLSNMENRSVRNILEELQNDPDLADRRDWIGRLIEQWVENNSNLEPWSPQDIRTFAIDHEIDPKTVGDLFKIALKRLSEIKYDVEKSDNSLREEVRAEDQEPLLRRWLARKLRERARKRYTVPQEEEIDQQQRPDLRLESPPLIGPVSIEMKLADNWSFNQLVERLKNQLVGQYLRAYNSRYGIYLLAMHGDQDRKWNSEQGRLSFQQLLEVLETHAKKIEEEYAEVEGLKVIGIDFRVNWKWGQA